MYQSKIAELPSLESEMYENIFKVYKTDKNHFFYNITKAVKFPDLTDDTVYDLINVAEKQSWTSLSFKHYGTMHLWWLILAANKITNPVKQPESGTVLKLIKPDFVPGILREIKNSL